MKQDRFKLYFACLHMYAILHAVLYSDNVCGFLLTVSLASLVRTRYFSVACRAARALQHVDTFIPRIFRTLLFVDSSIRVDRWLNA